MKREEGICHLNWKQSTPLKWLSGCGEYNHRGLNIWKTGLLDWKRKESSVKMKLLLLWLRGMVVKFRNLYIICCPFLCYTWTETHEGLQKMSESIALDFFTDFFFNGYQVFNEVSLFSKTFSFFPVPSISLRNYQLFIHFFEFLLVFHFDFYSF